MSVINVDNPNDKSGEMSVFFSRFHKIFELISDQFDRYLNVFCEYIIAPDRSFCDGLTIKMRTIMPPKMG